MIDHTGHESQGSSSGQAHSSMDEVVLDGRQVWVERDAAGTIVGVSESRQVLEDTDDDYAVIVRHRTHDRP